MRSCGLREFYEYLTRVEGGVGGSRARAGAASGAQRRTWKHWHYACGCHEGRAPAPLGSATAGDTGPRTASM
ncbi:unnamed protein product, partial [Iphiclides podalirius]